MRGFFGKLKIMSTLDVTRRQNWVMVQTFEAWKQQRLGTRTTKRSLSTRHILPRLNGGLDPWDERRTTPW